MQELADAELIRRSAEGDQMAFTELVHRYRGSMVALIRRLVPDLDKAEDLLQETLALCWLNIGRVHSPERVQAWLLQVARNRCRDYHRSTERRERPTEQQELETYVNRYGRTALRERVTEDLDEALHTLTTAEREAVRLFYMQGFTIKEICAQTQSSVSAVKSRLFTARHHLRTFFDIDERKENSK